MPIFFQQDIDQSTKLAVWRIEEGEGFFLQHVPLQREITHPHKRRQHLAGRYLLQYLCPDFPINLIKIADTRKPYLDDEAYHFSISHCSTYAAAIVSKNKRVGIDIEVPTPKVEKIMHKFLHEEEQKAFSLQLLAASQEKELYTGQGHSERETPDPKLTLLWSCKEAVFKWWSYGNVDFSEMIRIEPFSLVENGTIDARFIAETGTTPLQLHYRLLEGICLAWVID
ncbi:MAG TPA: 4'-phosphopantetheinyl transferase superfamily protein [Flavisolibacter sp.]|nr:4'-phosphopantetheinyl transferase superfamily protein [Flavisolibacter sp.]